MSNKKYALLEEHIINTFESDRLFRYYGKLCEVIYAGKPRPKGGGECKTDIFVKARDINTGKELELKISVKNMNKEFMGNKLKKEDVEAYLGSNWENILINASTSIRSSFERRVLMYATGHHPTKQNSVTVGWKLEIADRPRALSVPIPLSDREIRDYIYKGTNLTKDKKDSIVNGKEIPNSGVADFLLVTCIENIQTSNDVINQMELIDNANIGDTYFIFTANNYRTDVDSADGQRALAVRIEWEVIDGKMIPIFHYDNPLKYTGKKDMAPLVKRALAYLGKRNVTDIKPGIDVDEEFFKK
jgi:bspRI restriction endonuclease